MTEKEFIPYEQALALKELGFDEPCFTKFDTYSKKNALYPILATIFLNGPYQYEYNGYDQKIINSEFYYRFTGYKNSIKDHGESIITSPLYQQAFRWFREKHGLHSTITSISQESWQWHITKPSESLGKLYGEDFYTYEETELACLQKLIEITKIK